MDNIAEETYFFVTHMFNLIYFKAFSFIIETYGLYNIAPTTCVPETAILSVMYII